MNPKPLPPAQPEEPLMNVKQVAAFLGMSPSWVYKASANGTLPTVPVGASIRFRPADVRAYVAAQARREVAPVLSLHPVK